MGFGDGLDDFSKRRLAEVYDRWLSLRRSHDQICRDLWIGTLMQHFDRRDLELLRSEAALNRLDLDAIARLDRTFTEHLALEDRGDTTTCAHCGGELTRCRKTVDVVVMGQTRRFHGARRPCARAAYFLGGPEPGVRRRDEPHAVIDLPTEDRRR